MVCHQCLKGHFHCKCLDGFSEGYCHKVVIKVVAVLPAGQRVVSEMTKQYCVTTQKLFISIRRKTYCTLKSIYFAEIAFICDVGAIKLTDYHMAKEEKGEKV